MEFKSQIAVAPQNDSSESPVLSSWSQGDGYDPPNIGQSHDIALVTRLLDRSYSCHGVCNEKILLWGLPGCGKRRIATQAALQFSARSGCKILWVEGRSFECFMRDYRAAYTTVTGEHLPHGLTLGHTLLKMRATLETRRNEWLMVIFDLQSYLEDDIEEGLNGSNLYLPEWCRFLVTSSYVVPKPGSSIEDDEAMACGVKFARRATCLHVTAFSEESTKQYLKTSRLDSQDIDFPAFRHKSPSSITPLRLALSCASMRLLQISASQFHRLCLRKARKSSSPTWPPYTPIFADSMSILWDALNDYDTAPGRLLAICSMVDRRDIPIVLVKQFPDFRDHEERLITAINILRLTGLIEIHPKYGMDTINLHLLQYRWLQFKLKRTQDERENRHLVHTWVAVLNKHLIKPDEEISKEGPIFSAEKFWSMFAHVAAICNLKPPQVRKLCSVEYMRFLKHVGIFFAEDGLLPGLAGITITHAFNMCTLLQSRRSDDLELDRECVHIRQVRAMAFLKVSEYRQGEIELREAKQLLNRRLAGDADSKQKLRQIQDAEAHLSICQGKWSEAGRILDELLASLNLTLTRPRSHSDTIGWPPVKELWTKISAAWSIRTNYSSMTMGHWLTLPYEEQWGFNDSRRLHWVEKHMLNLIDMRKYKGALLLGRKLLERARELTPVVGQSISRLTYRVVYCLCVLDKVDEAEKAVCQLLEMATPEKDVDDTSKSYLLHTLHELAIAMQRNGRTVEAEGLYRLNIRSATLYDVKTLSGTEKYDTWRDWMQLVMCLIEQGKVLEARKSKDEYQSEEADDEFLNSTIQNTLAAYGYAKDLYAQALEAERSQTSVEFRASLKLAGTRPVLNRAIKSFGSIRRRIERDHDFESDIDLHHIGRARNSRLLQLLEFPLVYLSFIATNSKQPCDDPKNSEYLWANRRQSVLGQYWKLCQCRRKRRRSQSVHELHNYVVKQGPDRDSHRKKLKQKLITDWVTRIPVTSKKIPEGCGPSCPCIEANKRGQAETAALESKLFVWKEPAEELSKPKSQSRYRKPKPRKGPIPDDEMFHLIRPNTWWWVQSEFANVEIDNENYIIPRAVEIPGISITPPEGQDYLLPITPDPQEKLMKYYETDYAAGFERVLEKEKTRRYQPTRLDDVLEDEEDA